jgi:general L-amino acid transport system substrate-binding protein
VGVQGAKPPGVTARALLLALLSLPAAAAVRCGGVPKPGLAYPDGAGHVIGLEVDLCRAVAVAVGDRQGATFHPYLQPQDFAAARSGADQVAFLTASEMIAAGLTDVLLPGPAVFYETQGIMVPAGSPVRSASDLGDRPLCVEPGTEAERGAQAWFAARHLPFAEFPFQEQQEMLDAFSSGSCGAVIEETTTLGALRVDAEAVGKHVRILPEAMAPNPLLASSRAADGAWAAMLAWVVATLVRADQSGAAIDPPGRLRALPLGATPAGLRPGWQARVLEAVGSYGDVLRRNLGDGSPWHLPAGPNAAQTEGGLLAAPASQ